MRYRKKLDTFLCRSKRLRYSDVDIPEVAEMFESADETLFSRIIRNDQLLLRYYLPDLCEIQHTIHRVK